VQGENDPGRQGAHCGKAGSESKAERAVFDEPGRRSQRSCGVNHAHCGR